jgi:formylglycine-generating enzyme required for sulfatase activity
MTRKLLAGRGWVKDAAVASALLALFAGCASAPPAERHVDPYGVRVSNCVVGPRTLNDSLQAAMVSIAGGPAVLGSTEAERAQARLDYGAGGDKLFRDETRVRRAHVKAFRIDRTTVTPRAYYEFVSSCGVRPPDHELITESAWNALRKRFAIPFTYAQIQPFLWDENDPPPGRDPKMPVVLVTQDDAGLYCAWRGARLPTEDEWERAARGQQGSIYPWGNSYDAFRVNNATRGTGDALPVGSLTQGASPDGILDMGGNVYEWTSTPWPGKKDLVVVKGNAFDGRGGYGRGAARLAFPKDMRNVTLGFRCAADVY